jgi:hypothetical protein
VDTGGVVKTFLLASAALALLAGVSAVHADIITQSVQCDYVSKADDRNTVKDIPTMQQTFQTVFEFTADGKVFGFAKSVNGTPLKGLAAELSRYDATITQGHYVFTKTFAPPLKGTEQFNIDRVTGVMTGHELDGGSSFDFWYEGKCSTVTLPEPKL